MSKRPTKAERKGLAKKARLEAQRRSDRARIMRRVYVVIGILVVGGGITAAVVFKPKPAPPPSLVKVNAAAVAAGCTPPAKQADEGHSHVSPPTRVPYKTNPPTSGSHYSITGTAPANTGVWTTPVQDEFQVHNLEHHHTVVQYAANVDPGVKAALESLARDANFSGFVLVAPRPNMPANTTLAVTAWDYISTCQAPTDASKVGAFVSAAAVFFRDTSESTEQFLPGSPNP